MSKLKHIEEQVDVTKLTIQETLLLEIAEQVKRLADTVGALRK